MNRILLACLLAYAPLVFADTLTQDSELVQTCGACHGIDGNSVLPMVPNLAGQLSGYLLYEMNAFKTHDRVDPMMDDIMDPLTERQIYDLVKYYKAQKFVPMPPAEPLDPQLVAAGKKLYTQEITEVGLSCADCHGANAMGVVNFGILKDFPRLAGEKYDYLVSNLTQYANRSKHHSLLGMRQVAASLNEQEIKELASYLSSLQ